MNPTPVNELTNELTDEAIYLAGQRVRPGLYVDLNSKREVRLEQEDTLPATLDGRVACYVALRYHWSHMDHQYR